MGIIDYSNPIITNKLTTSPIIRSNNQLNNLKLPKILTPKLPKNPPPNPNPRISVHLKKIHPNPLNPIIFQSNLLTLIQIT